MGPHVSGSGPSSFVFLSACANISRGTLRCKSWFPTPHSNDVGIMLVQPWIHIYIYIYVYIYIYIYSECIHKGIICIYIYICMYIHISYTYIHRSHAQHTHMKKENINHTYENLSQMRFWYAIPVPWVPDRAISLQVHQFLLKPLQTVHQCPELSRSRTWILRTLIPESHLNREVYVCMYGWMYVCMTMYVCIYVYIGIHIYRYMYIHIVYKYIGFCLFPPCMPNPLQGVVQVQVQQYLEHAILSWTFFAGVISESLDQCSNSDQIGLANTIVHSVQRGAVVCRFRAHNCIRTANLVESSFQDCNLVLAEMDYQFPYTIFVGHYRDPCNMNMHIWFHNLSFGQITNVSLLQFVKLLDWQFDKCAIMQMCEFVNLQMSKCVKL